jgi:MoxR-like ATPase
VPYPSPELLKAAAADLAGSHPLTIVTIPALLHAGKFQEGNRADEGSLPIILGFGSKQERPVLESFRLRENSQSPYLAVWQDPPAFVRHDYPSSTTQAQRTRETIGQALFNIPRNEANRRIGTALRPTAGKALFEHGIKPVSRLSIALWLGRNQDLPNLDAWLDWFDAQYPLEGTDLDGFYTRDMPRYATSETPEEELLRKEQPSNDELIEVIAPAADDVAPLDVSSTTPPTTESLPDLEPGDDDLRWTRDFHAYPLRDADVSRITQAVLKRLDDRGIVLPEAESLVKRCVTALLIGHLVLQGPPGTGKTTLARILADAFAVHLLESTATSDWSPFHVVGGLRPAADGSLQPSYGKVADAALKCAINVRADMTAEAEGEPSPDESPTRRQGTWLLIDEFNRADIDKAIGSLYTLLSSSDADHLKRSPIDLWFETGRRQQLWVPARFRIIATMNDLDTSFVNPISQGLTRRFQFITVGTPDTADDSAGIGTEMEKSLRNAYEWLTSTYGAVLKLDSLDATQERLSAEITSLQSLVAALRETTDTAAGWPVGTAQVVDVLRVLLLQHASGTKPGQALDWGIADRLVAQMGQLDEPQLQRASDLFEQAGLTNARSALQHLLDPHTT